MVQAIVTFNERQNRVLTIVKGKFGLKNKAEAVNLIVEQYEKNLLAPELRPDYREKLLKIDKGRFKSFSGVDRLKKALEHA